MGPYGILWSRFGAFIMLLSAIVLALAWAAWDRRREQREDRGREEGEGRR